MYLDDTEVEEEGIAEVLLDDNAIAEVPRWGEGGREGRSGDGKGQTGHVDQQGQYEKERSGISADELLGEAAFRIR